MKIYIFILLVICTSCYTGQSFFNKLYSESYQGPKASATPVFTFFYGTIVSIITFALNGFTISASMSTIVFGLTNGIILFLYYLGMIKAATRGPYSFQSIVMLMGSIVVCIVASKILWNDHISFVQYIGIAIMLVSFVVLNFGGLDLSGVKKGYYFWTISIFFSNGIFGVLLDAQQRQLAEEKNEMIFITFLTCAVFSLAYLIIVQKGDMKGTFDIGKKALLFSILSSVCAGFAIYLLMVLLASIPSYILYTINNGTILVASQILCATVLKEHMTKKTVLGIMLSVISIIILSL